MSMVNVTVSLPDQAEITTLDRRHFTVVRPKHVEAFTLLS